MSEDHTEIVVLKTRFDNLETSLTEHRNDFKEFKKENKEEHKSVKESIVNLQKVLYGAMAIISFILFSAQVLPVVGGIINKDQVEIETR